MKISILIPTLNLGGAETQTINQINALVERGVEVQLIVLSNEVDLQKQLTDQVELIIINEPNFRVVSQNFFLKLFKLKKIVQPINNFQPDIVIANLKPAHIISRLIYPKINSKPRLFFYHHSTENGQNPANSIFKKILKKWEYRNERNINPEHLFISNAVQKDIESAWPLSKGYLLYNAVPNQKIDVSRVNKMLDQYQLNEKEYLIIPGRLHAVKGHLFCLNAIKHLITKYNIKIVFAGYGPLYDQINSEYHSLIKSKNLIITGRLENLDLLALIKGAKAVIIPSIEEGLGNVAIESLMLGKLTIASNAGGLPEVIRHNENGFLFDKLDGSQLVDLLEKYVFSENAIPFQTESIIQSYLDKFTLNVQINQLLSLTNTDIKV